MDRNIADKALFFVRVRSLSARRAWIEIWCDRNLCRRREVALRKESVDRNSVALVYTASDNMSLSARRAWIEIYQEREAKYDDGGRSPQGERG